MFFVLHGLVMVMKQHSYAFYNGHLSSVHKKRKMLEEKLRQLDRVAPTESRSLTSPPVATISTAHLDAPPSAEQRRHSMSLMEDAREVDIDRISQAIVSGEPLDQEQVQLFGRIIKWEVYALADELQGTASHAAKAYPNNLTFLSHYKWIPLPTVVYELEYPQSESIDWWYVAEKLIAMIGIIFVMIQVSQSYICKLRSQIKEIICLPYVHEDPVVMKTVEIKEKNMSLWSRLAEFPWILSDLVFPFMMEYLVCLPLNPFQSSRSEYLTVIAYMVLDMGNHTEHIGGAHVFCGSQLL